MPSEFGEYLRKERLKQGIGLRELSRRIGKSPALIVALEREDEVPSVTEDTIRLVAKELALSVDKLLILASKHPQDVSPDSEVELQLYRLIKRMGRRKQEALLKNLKKKRNKDH